MFLRCIYSNIDLTFRVHVTCKSHCKLHHTRASQNSPVRYPHGTHGAPETESGVAPWTPSPHAPGARMTRVKQTPSN